MLLIVAATRYELAGLWAALPRLKAAPASERLRGCRLNLAEETELQVIGMGRKSVQNNLPPLLARLARQNPPEEPGRQPNQALLLGFAGGLNPAWRTGDLCLPDRYLLSGVDPEAGAPGPDSLMLKRAQRALSGGVGWRAGPSLTAAAALTSPRAKREAFQRYRAGIVNLEDYWAAAAARQAGVPFLAVRAVLDPAGQRLPGCLLAIPPDSVAGAARYMATHPWSIPGVWHLARQARAAGSVLARFALAYRFGVAPSEEPLRRDRAPTAPA